MVFLLELCGTFVVENSAHILVCVCTETTDFVCLLFIYETLVVQQRINDFLNQNSMSLNVPTTTCLGFHMMPSAQHC